jgi:stearoyl-CoA desaturase (delta-9 desaturase)
MMPEQPPPAREAFAGIPQERMFLSNERLRARGSRSNSLMVGGSFVATIAALGELVFFHATPSALWVALVTYIVGMLGITVGFHRLFSHRSFAAGPALRVVLAIAGSITAQGSVTHWVANHRRHHVFTDQAEDVHSPHCKGGKTFGKWRGFWHAQLSWIYSHRPTNPLVFAKDILRDRALQRVSQLYPAWIAAGVLLPALLVGSIEGTWRGVLDGALWGGGVRMFLGIMLPSAVNSFGHMVGSRPFATSDHSRNVAWLAWLTLGEGWHNNHHAFPASARLGLRWWQLDAGWGLICLLRALGVVSDVRTPESLGRAPR